MKLAFEPVITWQSPRSRNVNVTPDQEQTLKDARVWLKDCNGNDYATVSRGLHNGRPTFTDQQIARIAAGEHCMDVSDDDYMQALPSRANDGD